MPISESYPQPNIVHSIWEGEVTAADVLALHERGTAVIKQKNISAYVSIIDLSKCRTILFDARFFTMVVIRNQNLRVGIVLIRPTPSMIGLIKVISLLTRYNVQIVDAYEQAFVTASAILESNAAKPSKKQN